MPKIILIDDDQPSLETLQAFLEEIGYEVDIFNHPIQAINSFKKGHYDLAISDLKMPEIDGTILFKKIKEIDPDIPFLLITAYATVQTAVELIRDGAKDYLLKPLDLAKVKNVVKETIELSLFQRSHLKSVNHGSTLLGVDKSIRSLIATISQIARSNASVLIRGESGTGKELIAKEIHNKSLKSGNLVAVNCGAIPNNLFESILFGHEEGSFTGADKQVKGKIEAAQNGTLFLDEIADLPIEVQVKLLRFLSTKEIERVGGSNPIEVNCRVIAATNCHLESMVKKGEFREDLFYRLNVIELISPPLRERLNDLPALFSHFLNQNKNSWEIKSIHPEVIKIFNNYPWPGNIRELRNCVESIQVMNNDGNIKIKDLPIHVQNFYEKNMQISTPLQTMQEVEIFAIEETLKLVDGNRRRAAEILGISERTIYRKLNDDTNVNEE